VAMLTNAGGPGILAAEACGAHGSTRGRWRLGRSAPSPSSPPGASLANQVDLVAGASPHDFARALRVLADDPAVDAVVTIFVPALVTRADDVAHAVVGVISAGCDVRSPRSS
jgi:acyl-CoA synthetase (NDP forming)